MGCIRSHLEVIRIAKQRKLKWFLMLEDDAGFKDGFDELLKEALAELPDDWDALWLGGSVVKTEPYSPRLNRLIAGTGGYCILFRETMYDAIIHIQQLENDMADVAYMKIQPKWNCFRTVQNLILHKDGFSTIQKRMVKYPKLSQ